MAPQRVAAPAAPEKARLQALSLQRPKTFTVEAQQAQKDAVAAHQEATTAETDITDVAYEAFKRNQIAPLIYKQLGREDLADDPQYTFTREAFTEHVKGAVPEQYWSEFTPSDIRSEGQLFAKIREAQEDAQSQELMNSHGFLPRLGLEVGASLLDLPAYAVGAATSGLAAPLIFTNKVTRLERAVKGGLLSMAGTAPIEAYIATQDMSYSASDAVISTLAVGALGGVLSARGTRDEQALRELYQSALADEAAQAGAVVSNKGAAHFGAQNVKADGTLKNAAEQNEGFFDKVGGHKTAAAWARLDRAATNLSSQSTKMRQVSSVLMEDPAPAKGSLVGETAPLWKSREASRATRTLLNSRNTHLKTYMEEKGLGWTQKEAARLEFNKDVIRVLRGGSSTNAAVNAHAVTARKLYSEIADMANTPVGNRGVAVKGAEDMKLDNYVNRRWSASAFEAMQTKLGSRKALQTFIARGLRGMEEKEALEVADHLIDVTVNSRVGGLDVDAFTKNAESLSHYLQRDHLISPQLADRIADALAKKKGGDDAGRAGNLKHRMDVDEAALEDLFENDLDALFGHYSNTMYGHISLARQGIDSEATFNKLRDEALDELKALPNGNADRVRSELQNLQDSYDRLVGRAIGEDPSKVGARYARWVRKVQYSRLMNMVGIAQIAELGVIATQVGIRNMLSNIPAFMKLRRDLRSGAFKDEHIEELSDLIGGWGDYGMLHRSQQRIEDFGGNFANQQRRHASIEKGLDNLNNITTEISGFNFVNKLLHVNAMKSMSKAFTDTAFTGKKFPISTARLRELGIDDAAMKAIRKEITSHATRKGKNRKVETLNLEKWDSDVRNTFGNAMRRWGNIMVQENEFGSLPAFMDTTVGKLLGQFKSFMVGAYAKQVVNNVKHADRTTVMQFFNTIAAGSLSYMAYTYLSSFGKQDRQKYLDERFSFENIALGAFQRSSISVFFPSIIDTATSLLGVDPLFDKRNSGLGNDIVTGSAAYDFFSKAGTAIKGAAAVARGDDLDQQTARAAAGLLPFQNALVIRNVLQAVFETLPRNYHN